MYARTLESVLAEAGASPAAVKLTVEMQELVRVVQRDLRGIVRTLRPSPAAELGLAAAVRVLADGAPRHAGLAVTVHCGPGIEGRTSGYSIASELVPGTANTPPRGHARRTRRARARETVPGASGPAGRPPAPPPPPHPPTMTSAHR